MSLFNHKERPLTLLATVAIVAATLGFAGGLSLNQLTNTASSQSQMSNQTDQVPQEADGFLKEEAPMSPSQRRNREGLSQQEGQQGMLPPDAVSGASQSTSEDDQSSSASDEINELKKRNQEIKAQIENDDKSTSQ